MPFFSVIIPTFNRYERTQAAVDSVLAQTFTDYELIVVDDGSTDRTPDLERIYGNKIRYFRQENKGVSAARNRGIAHANSPYIALLDSDDLWLLGKLHMQREFIEKSPEIRIHQTDETWVRRGRRVNQMDKHLKKEGDIFIPSLKLCLISPSAVVIDRTLLEEAGTFDESLPVCEDYDLWLRLLWKERAGLVPEKLAVKYGGHDDQLSRSTWGLDRYRVYSILKLLDCYGHAMKEEYAANARSVAVEKCGILAKGARRRGNLELYETVVRITKVLRDDTDSSIDYRSLLKE